jgi:hypothetical protein
MPKPAKDESAAVEPAVSEGETITITRSKWDEVQKALDMLRNAADKGRLEREEAKSRVKGPLEGRISVIKGKAVVGWTKKRDFVGKNQHGVWIEDQVMTVTDEDGKEYDMIYVDFAKIEKVPCQFVAEIREEDGRVIKKCRVDGREDVLIQVDYVN